VDFKSKCVGDLVVIRPDDIKPAKIALPDWQRVLKGFVLAVGPGKSNRKGTGLVPMECSVGDYVQFGAAAGMESTFDGTQIRIMRDTDVDLILKTAAEHKAELDAIAEQWK